MNKQDRKLLRKTAARVKDAAGRKSKRGKKVLGEYREYLADSGYDPDEIQQQTSRGAFRWQDERVYKARRAPRAKYTRKKVYVYKHEKKGKTVKGRWLSHANYSRSVKTTEYWRDIRRLQSLYEYDLKEARGIYKRVNSPQYSLEFRNELRAMLRDAFGDTPIKDAVTPRRQSKAEKRRVRSASMKQYWKTIRRIRNKKGLTLAKARHYYTGTLSRT